MPDIEVKEVDSRFEDSESAREFIRPLSGAACDVSWVVERPLDLRSATNWSGDGADA